jgi:tetratricopeptide (TPR) repeat protein
MNNSVKIIKMKTRLTILMFTFFGLVSQLNAQNEAECAEKLSVFAELAKVKNYQEAATHLQYLRDNCASFHPAIYQLGEPTLKFLIDNATSPEAKESQVRDLMLLYDQSEKNFPGKIKGTNIKKALALFDNNVGSKDEIFQILDQAFKNDRENFTDALAMYVYFEIFVDKFESGKSEIQLQEVFDKYDLISDKLQEETNKLSEAKDELIKLEESQELSDRQKRDFARYEINLEAYETIGTSMDAKISLLATCDRLIPFLSKSFEEKKGDVEWLSRAAARLYKKDCSSDPLFAKISEALHVLNPTAKSAYNLGVAAYNSKDTQNAIKYFNQAAELHSDNNEKAKVYYTMATTVYGNGNKVQARAHAEKALAAKPSYGKAYLYIAQLYANSINDCGDDPFDKRAVYWLAAQTARKAGQVDSSLKTTAGQQAAGYEQRAPSRQEIFSSGKSGQSVTFKCWIGKSIAVPKLD